MDSENKRPATPRRRRRSKLQNLKEAYLPVIIAGAALVLILIFIIGSITRAVQRRQIEKQANIDASVSEAEKLAQLEEEANGLILDAENFAIHFDYEGAIAMLDCFTGDPSQFTVLGEKRNEYQQAMDAMISWDDPNQVVNLSIHQLVADPARAFTDPVYANSYDRNYLTTEEFSMVLQQLYENGYILIRLSDITSGTLYLPAGKKPLILTQTNVNYYTYMTDSDGDKLPDKDADGFASKLVLDANGNLTCEMVDSTGQTVTGAYDLVPILDAFVQTHPDFSYCGAKAILAVTGYDGLFGYRTDDEAREFFGADYYDNEVSSLSAVIDSLRLSGYDIACYTFRNVAYGNLTAEEIRQDLDKWSNQVSPILGTVDTLVFAKNSDIATGEQVYTGDKFDILLEFGFTNYLGFCTDGTPWYSTQDGYVRQGRLMLTGANLMEHPDWFRNIFDAISIKDPQRITEAELDEE